jgi:phytoene/squalene synthetase
MVEAPSRAARSIALPEAQAACIRLAREHYENFTVLSWLTPRRLRPHRAAIYAFCRTVDDLGDEVEGDRLVQLDRFETDLDAAFAGAGHGPVFTALADTIARFDLPREPFVRLIEANRIDQRQLRYETFDDLVGYCEHSANPVGRLVLLLHGHRDDIARDLEKGRIYLPQDEMRTFGVEASDLAVGEASDALVKLIRFQVERTRGLFARGLPLVDRVRGRLRIELALFSRGGLAILDTIEAQGFDTLRRRPTISALRKRRLIALTILDLFFGRRSWT